MVGNTQSQRTEKFYTWLESSSIFIFFLLNAFFLITLWHIFHTARSNRWKLFISFRYFEHSSAAQCSIRTRSGGVVWLSVVQKFSFSFQKKIYASSKGHESRKNLIDPFCMRNSMTSTKTKYFARSEIRILPINTTHFCIWLLAFRIKIPMSKIFYSCQTCACFNVNYVNVN